MTPGVSGRAQDRPYDGWAGGDDASGRADGDEDGRRGQHGQSRPQRSVILAYWFRKWLSEVLVQLQDGCHSILSMLYGLLERITVGNQLWEKWAPDRVTTLHLRLEHYWDSQCFCHAFIPSCT